MPEARLVSCESFSGICQTVAPEGTPETAYRVLNRQIRRSETSSKLLELRMKPVARFVVKIAARSTLENVLQRNVQQTPFLRTRAHAQPVQRMADEVAHRCRR